MIMNARDIQECLLPLGKLKIDKAWFRGFAMAQLGKAISDLVRGTDYERYIMVSDDVIVTDAALEHILRWQEAVEIVTGWCNLSPHILRANLILGNRFEDRSHYGTTRKMPQAISHHIENLVSGGIFPFKEIYQRIALQSFPSCREIWMLPELFPTYFMGWSMTSLPRGIWLKYGFNEPRWSGPAFGSDAVMSGMLRKDKVEMWCARDAFMWHLHSKRNFIVGKVTPRVIFEKRATV